MDCDDCGPVECIICWRSSSYDRCTGLDCSLCLFQIPPITKSAWRLQSTNLFLCVGFVYDWKHSSPEIRQKWRERKILLLLFASGVSLAIHFGCWIYSLDYTSLDHSLLFVTAHPLVLVVGHFFFYVFRWSRSRPSLGEFGGTLIGFIGMGVTVLDVRRSDSEATILGDLVAFVGSVGIIGYLLAGRYLRSWMPLFLYACPVTVLASLLLSLAALVEDVPKSLIFFGWFTRWEWFAFVMYVGFFPGIFGHTGINFVLKYLHPLIVSVSLLLEPVIGSTFGYLLGVAPFPGMCMLNVKVTVGTLVGAPMIIFGLLSVTVSASRRQKREELQKEEKETEENQRVELEEI